MSARGACGECRYYIGIDDDSNLNRRPYGNCQRFPPQVFFVSPDIVRVAENYSSSASDPLEPYYQTRWPVVSYDDSCGEFVQDTNGRQAAQLT